MRRVQFVFDRSESKHVIDVTVPDLPRKGEVYLFHEYADADSDEEPWEVQQVFKDLWPGGHATDGLDAPPISDAGLPLYHEGGTVIVLLRRLCPTT